MPDQQIPATEGQSEEQATAQANNRMSVRGTASAADQKVHEASDRVKQ